MDSSLDLDRGELEEQPLNADEKQLLSEYFQLEGRRQFENFRSVLMFEQGYQPGLFDLFSFHHDLIDEISEKKLSLELSQRDHWIDLMSSIHERFYDDRPSQPEITLWALLSLEKHATVQLKTGQEEYKKLLRKVQQQQLPLIGRLGEHVSRRFTKNLDLFYSLLDIDGLSTQLIGVH